MVVSPRADIAHRDALQSAENLLEAQSVVQIREVEAKARNDIEDKKQQLRQLVGGSYRDLIDSADTILTMTKLCQATVGHVNGIQSDFARLTDRVSQISGGKSHSSQPGSQREQLYAVGSRVKYIVDTSELLWGCLDTQDYLEAAHRYLRAAEVHKLLTTAKSVPMGRFPLLRHQWPSIQSLKSQISDGIQQRLKVNADLTSQDAAAAVVAASFLDQLDSEQALKLFLECCHQRAIQPLAAAAQGTLSQHDLQALLTRLAETVQEVFAQVGELFLSPSATAGSPLMVRKASEDIGKGELLFSPLPGQDRSQEPDAWQAVKQATLRRLAPMTQATASSACSSWLGQLAKDIARHCPAPMAACATSADFASLESHLRSAIAQWQPMPSPTSPEAARVGATPRPSPLTPLQQSPFNPPETHQGVPDSWKAVCAWVLGKQLNLWQQLFEQPFLMRAQQMITASFTSIAQGFHSPLQACLKAAQKTPPAAPGGYSAPQWPEQADFGSNSTQLGVISRHAGGNSNSYRLRKRLRPNTGGAEGDSPEEQGWRALLVGVCHQVNTQLKEALDSSQQLLGKHDQNHDPASSIGVPGINPSPIEGKASGRAEQLQGFIQQQCASAVRGMAEELEQQLQQLGQAGMDIEGTKLVEQALLIGRLAGALGSRAPALGLIMGDPKAWGGSAGGVMPYTGPAVRQTSKDQRTADKPSPSAALLNDLQQQLRSVSMKGYELWAGWAAKGLCLELQAALQTDAALTSPTVLQGWEETVILQEDSMDEGAGEMRFSLPAAPSPGPLLFLLAACREVARAGGHTTGAVPVQLLQWQLSNAVLQAFSEVLQSSSSLSSSLSERGLLQLLFDVRFLADALAGAKPLNDPTPAQAPTPPTRSQRNKDKLQSPAVQERQRAFQSLEGSLSSQLDPIDWATYEPYLWSNEATYYQRSATLFGALMQTCRMHSQVTPKPATSLEANILSMAPTAPRFSYLPVSTPSVTSSTPHGLQPTTTNLLSTGTSQGLVPASPGALAKPSALLDQTGSFSFAHINVGRAMSAANAEQQRAAQSASGTTLENLQSRFTAGTTGTSQRLGAFGSLLGDKAAEVTAMAQQSLGDYVPTAFPSRLSSSSLSDFTSGATGLFAGFKGLRGSNA